MGRDYSCRVCEATECIPVVTGIRDWEYGIAGEYSFVRCESCRMVQLHPFPSLEQLKAAYDVDYHGYAAAEDISKLFSCLYAAKDLWLKRRIRRWLPDGARVLDIGCGDGKFLLLIKGLGASYLEGIDFNAQCVEKLRMNGIHGHCGTFDEYVKEDHFFDMVAMNNYLEHTLDPLLELEKARRLLKPSGVLMGEVPGFNSIERWIFGKYWGGNHVPRHTFQFCETTLKAVLAKVGFSKIEVTHELNTGHWALSVQNWFQRNVGDLRANPRLRHGRARYYSVCLLAFIPVNALCVMLRRAGVNKFFARA